MKRSRKIHVTKNKKMPFKENIGSIFLNKSLGDRISFSVLRDETNKIQKIENISYEILIEDKWEWVVRYDDHGGEGQMHRHLRISIEDDSDVKSSESISRKKSKNYLLTWAFKEIKNNYLSFRSKFLKNSNLDLY